MDKPKGSVKDIDWEDLYVCLYAFTDNLLRSKDWFRGRDTGTDSYLKGKQVHDYVSEAIEKYLRNPEKYDTTKGTLKNYLTFNLIRTLVGNDLRSAEHKTAAAIPETTCLSADNAGLDYRDLLLPRVEEYFGEQLDYKLIMSRVESEIKSDKIVEELFLGVCVYDLARREVMEEFDMGSKDYDNGIRRLNTILSNVAKKFELKEEKRHE